MTLFYQPEYGMYNTPGRARSLRRARLFAGGTYFRSRSPSGQANKLSIELNDSLGQLIITNHNTIYTENVIGPVTVDFLDQQLNWNEYYLIDRLRTEPRLRKFVNDAEVADLGKIDFAKPFMSVANKLSFKLTLKDTALDGNTIRIQARTHRIPLVLIEHQIEGTDGSLPETRRGWDVDALRAAMTNDEWIQMMPRSGTPRNPDGTPGQPLAVKFDVQDDGIDEEFALPFPDTYLTGGDGLPDFPTPAGPPTEKRESIPAFMMHVENSEQPDGSMDTVYDMYEWIPDSINTGTWKQF